MYQSALVPWAPRAADREGRKRAPSSSDDAPAGRTQSRPIGENRHGRDVGLGERRRSREGKPSLGRLAAGRPGEPAGGDPTIDFRAKDPAPGPQPAAPPRPPEYSFLAAPRRRRTRLAGALSRPPADRLGGHGTRLPGRGHPTAPPRGSQGDSTRAGRLPEAAARFVRKARAAAAIKHDHVVTIYRVGEAQGVAFLAMEYLQGISLQHQLERGDRPRSTSC